MNTCAVIVFAKAPLPGHAKTRLAVALGDAGAALLAERMMHATVDAAVAADVGPVQLCVTPDADHPAFAAAQQRHAITITDQGDGDLGERMARAFRRVLASHGRALLIGTDAPQLDAAYLRAAAGALDGADAVLGPASDGGYTLVGLKRPAPRLFLQMRWSHESVMSQTRQRLAQLQLRHAELPVLHDVDEPADLVHLPPHLLPPATKA
jgi:rSAM/selenodomain-associated transferase 1